MPRSVDPGLRDCLEQLKADGDRRLSARELADIIGEVAQTLTADLGPVSAAVQKIEADTDAKPASGADTASALNALAGIAGGDPGSGLLVELHQQLDEVRAAMQGAAATSLAAAEAIENIAAHPDMDADDQAHLYRFATEIFEASGFQDIAGQRLTRVAEMLKRIELSVVSARASLGDDGAAQSLDALSDVIERTETRKVEYILHGPQNAGNANTQEEIDKILASFD